MSDMTFLDAALLYAAKGWRVFPVEPKGKKPLITDWPNRATTDEHTIRTWWAKRPDANIGLATGKGSGVFVIDIDGEDGERSWTQLVTEIPDIPEETLTASTGSGRHLFFKYPPKREVRNRTAFRPGLDVRGEGGYVVAPPSVHPSGRLYAWPFIDSLDDLRRGEKRDTRIATAPVKLLNVTAPPKARETTEAPATKPKSVIPPWERQPETPKPTTPAAPPPRPPERPQGTPILERASLYLRECEPAVQGQGGHNALLWAARAMVIGFELSDSDALALLWSEFNPRCLPPWDRSNPAEVRDFERKVSEARNTPGEKSSGWLLDEYGLRSGDEALTAMGARLAAGLLAGHEREAAKTPAVVDVPDSPRASVTDSHSPTSALTEPDELPGRREFPLHCFPPEIRQYIEAVADVQVVDSAAVGLSVLVTAGAAMGNAFWLRLKGGFEVPPVLWGVVIARSGSNKSGPFREVVKPLRSIPAVDQIENAMLNPQGQLIIEDATTESVIDVLSRSHRGLCLANGELAGWVGSFDRYVQGGKKKAGGDESVWLKLWDGDSYQKNRKTDQECVFIERAAVSVIGCIQPRKMAECFDPSRFASGLVPRLLVVEIPPVFRDWSEREMSETDRATWSKTVEFLRTRPFASLDPNTGQYAPNIITPGMAAKERFVAHFRAMGRRVHEGDEWVASFASKAQGMAGRLALVLHGLGAAVGRHDIMSEIGEQTMCGGVELARYFLDEQLRMYGLGVGQFKDRRGEDVVEWIRSKKKDPGRTTAQENFQNHRKRYPTSRDSKRDLDELTEQGKLRREGKWYVLP